MHTTTHRIALLQLVHFVRAQHRRQILRRILKSQCPGIVTSKQVASHVTLVSK